MSSVGPGDASFDDQVRRIAESIREASRDADSIRSTSSEDFLVWLDQVVRQAAKALGITMAKLASALADFGVVIANAGSEFKGEFLKTYHETRKVSRRKTRGKG